MSKKNNMDLKKLLDSIPSAEQARELTRRATRKGWGPDIKNEKKPSYSANSPQRNKR